MQANGNAKRRERVESGIYQRADSVLEIGWRDAQGRQRWRVVEGGIIAARKALTAARAQRDRGDRIAADSRLTFNAAADAWLEARVARLRPATQAVYGAHLVHLRKRFGRVKLAAITPVEIARYIAELDRAGVAGWTQKGRLTVISGVFTYAGRYLGHVGTNPCSLLDRVERPTMDDEREHHILADAELVALLDAAHDQHRLLLATAAQTGARKGEVLGLAWGDIDTQARTLRIERQLDRAGQRQELKTRRSRRKLAITPDLAAALAEHRLACGRPPDAALVFERRDGTPFSHRAADRTLRLTAKRAGIEPPPTWHDLRHTHVSRLLAAGRDPVSVAARVGDSVKTVLSVYAHAMPSRADESEQLGALYDRGSAMEARGSNTTQQTATPEPAEVVDMRAKRNTTR